MGSATGEVSSLHDWFFKNGRRKRFIDWLGLDARIDSSIATAWEESKDRYNAFSSFFARFRLTGWKTRSATSSFPRR